LSWRIVLLAARFALRGDFDAGRRNRRPLWVPPPAVDRDGERAPGAVASATD